MKSLAILPPTRPERSPQGLAFRPQYFSWELLRKKFSPQELPPVSAARKENISQEGRLVWRYHSASTSPVTEGFSRETLSSSPLSCLICGHKFEKLNRNSSELVHHVQKKKLVGIARGIVIAVSLIMKAADL